MREYYRFIILQSNLQCFVEKQNRVIEHSRSVIKLYSLCAPINDITFVGKDSNVQHKRDEYAKYTNV